MYGLADSWRLDDLSQKIQVPPSVVRKKLAYWQAQGLIEETSTDQFSLIENIEQHARQESGIYFILLSAIAIECNLISISNRTSR